MTNPLIQIADLTLSVPEREPQKISFSLFEGDVLEIKGPSGSGKTTLLKTIARLHPSNNSEMKLDGESASSITPQIWRRKIAYLAQKPALLPGTAMDNMRAPFSLHAANKKTFPDERAKSLLKELGINESTAERGSKVLSGGEGARLALARALLLDPCVLLADEVSASLDDASRDRVITSIQNWMSSNRGAIIFAAHDQHFAEAFPERKILTLNNIPVSNER